MITANHEIVHLLVTLNCCMLKHKEHTSRSNEQNAKALEEDTELQQLQSYSTLDANKRKISH